jgi:hypothetical protein
VSLHHLTKSNFKLGSTCPFKLRYYKSSYPSTLKDNDMLDFFAEGGFMVEAIAHAVMRRHNPAVRFEQTFTHGRYSARVDGWEASGGAATLTEIKARSVDSGDPGQFFGSKGEVLSDWRNYLLDITFQVMVARGANPGRVITPQLCVVNRTKPSNVEAIYANIDLLEETDRDLPRAVFTGDVAALAADHFLEFIDCSAAVQALMPEVVATAAELLDFMDGNRSDIQPVLAPKPCKNCEFRGEHLQPNGFKECWGDTPPRGAHVIDIAHGTRGKELGSAVASMLERRDYHLANIPDSALVGGKSYGPTRRHHVAALRTNSVIQEPALVEILQGLEYPLHFIDFEASRIPVPYLPGMKPYEQVAFQFSCHTLGTPEATDLVHAQWLNLRDVYPNDEFVRELRKTVGDQGTVLVWSHYEKSTLRGVRRQLRERGLLDSSLADWFEGLVGPIAAPDENERDMPSGRRLVDLLDLSRAYFCHPKMGGSHSIKRVLDAIWSEASDLWSDPWFRQYYKVDANGAPMDPYLTLARSRDDELADTLDDDNGGIGVTDGVGAMRAYQSMLYGIHRGNETYRDSLAEALYRYCALDTAAMVMIWRYWLQRQ